MFGDALSVSDRMCLHLIIILVTLSSAGACVLVFQLAAAYVVEDSPPAGGAHERSSPTSVARPSEVSLRESDAEAIETGNKERAYLPEGHALPTSATQSPKSRLSRHRAASCPLRCHRAWPPRLRPRKRARWLHRYARRSWRLKRSVSVPCAWMRRKPRR